MIVGVFTELGSPGGIQRVCRHAVAVLAEMAERQGERCVLLSLNDTAGAHSISVAGRTAQVQGFGRSKAQLVRFLLPRLASARLLYLAHPGLARFALAHAVLRPGGQRWVAAYGVDVTGHLPRLVRLGLRGATGVTAISRFTADALVEQQGVDPARIRLVPCALEPPLAREDEVVAEELAVRGRILLTVGRLAAEEQYKGVDTVIRALPAVAERVPDVHFVVVGSGNDLPRLQELARATGVADRVSFLGRVSEALLAECYRRADVFVMPSLSEGFGIVYPEAMDQGLPVVAARSGGAPEVVSDGETGLLVEYGDTDALAQSLARLLSDPALRTSMGQAGRVRVAQNFTFEHFRRHLVDALAGDGGGTPVRVPASASS